MRDPAKSIDLQASDFAEDMTRVARIFAGEQAQEYTSEIVPGEAGYSR